jgi:hypothetical protein
MAKWQLLKADRDFLTMGIKPKAQTNQLVIDGRKKSYSRVVQGDILSAIIILNVIMTHSAQLLDNVTAPLPLVSIHAL